MNTIFELVRSYDAEAMKMVSDAVEASMPEEAKAKLYCGIYGHLFGGHFNECFAMEAVRRMYCADGDGNEHRAPYFTEPAVREWYEKAKDLVPEYNFWDFFVTVNMSVADYRDLVMRWFPDATAEEREKKYVELAVNFLNDPDDESTSRIWDYLNR